MSLAPLLNAAPAIPLHAFAAMAAFALGIVQFAAPKGTLPHRTLGWIWVVLMAVVASRRSGSTTSGWSGPWSPIHLLSIFTPIMLVLGVLARAQPPCARPQDHDDLDLCRRAGHRGAVHVRARADHARGGFRPLGERRKQGLPGRFPRPHFEPLRRRLRLAP